MLENKKSEFLNELETFKSKETYKFYKTKLERFFKYLYKYNIKKIDKKIVINFIKILKKTNINSTINKYVIILNKFFKFCNINIKLDTLRNDSERFINLSDNELKQLKKYIELLQLKQRLAIKLLIDTGLRLKELLDIKINNIDIKDNKIYLKETKTKEPRYIFFSDYIKKDLVSYIKNNTNVYLFNGCTRSFIYHIFIKIRKDTQIKKISPHILRHTFATNLLLCNLPLYTLQKILGHKNISTTQIYIHTNINQLKNDYKKAIKLYHK